MTAGDWTRRSFPFPLDVKSLFDRSDERLVYGAVRPQLGGVPAVLLVAFLLARQRILTGAKSVAKEPGGVGNQSLEDSVRRLPDDEAGAGPRPVVNRDRQCADRLVDQNKEVDVGCFTNRLAGRDLTTLRPCLAGSFTVWRILFIEFGRPHGDDRNRCAQIDGLREDKIAGLEVVRQCTRLLAKAQVAKAEISTVNFAVDSARRILPGHDQSLVVIWDNVHRVDGFDFLTHVVVGLVGCVEGKLVLRLAIPAKEKGVGLQFNGAAVNQAVLERLDLGFLLTGLRFLANLFSQL